MMIRTIIACFVILAAYTAIRQRQHERESEETEEAPRLFDSARLQGEIYALYRSAQELEKLDQLIIDLRLCKPDELHKAFRIQWQGSTGQERELDFMSTGDNANTAHMIELAEDQREKLNSEIQERIADLYARAQELDFLTDYAEEKRKRSYQNGEQIEPAGEW
jgi:hypothetical protein